MGFQINKFAKLEADCFYRVYNRANGYEKIFLSDGNYEYFLKQYLKYIHPFAETYCYCLMPNHFHFLIKIKNEQALKEQLQLTGFQNKDLPKFQTKQPDLTGFQNLSGQAENHSKYLSIQFSNFFNSYTKAFNKKYHRKGSLFMKPYKRIKVDNETYLKKLVHYIHFNPVVAGLTQSPKGWKYSSYPSIESSKNSFVKRAQLIALFEDEQNFIYCHKEL